MKNINELRRSARKLIRELGMLKLNLSRNRSPQHWHTLIEIANEPHITISKLGQLFLLPPSSMSRIVKSLVEEGLVIVNDGADKREKYLQITPDGLAEIKIIDEFSHIKIKGALEFLTDDDQNQIITSIQKYADALEKSRLLREKVKIHTLSTSRAIRKQIVSMIEEIQKNEFSLPVTDEINVCILKAESEFYFNNSYNFWYAVDDNGEIIGCIGLKKIDSKNGEIKKFFVKATYRGKGVSRKLLQTLIKSALKHHFNYLCLGTVASLHGAQRFYDKYGFARIDEKNLPSNFDKCPLDSVFFKAKVSDINNKLEVQVE